MPNMAVAPRKVVVLTLVLSLVIFIPVMALLAAGYDTVAGTAALAGVVGLFAGLLTGWRLGLGVLAGFSVASALAVPAGASPWTAGLLLAVTAGVTGLSAVNGWSGMLMMVPIAVAFVMADPPPAQVGSLDPALAVLLATVVGSGWGLVVGLGIRIKVKLPKSNAVSPVRAQLYAAALALLVGIAAWLVVQFQWGHGGAWFILTILVVYQPYLQDAMVKDVHRAAGTLIGFAVAMGLAWLIPNSRVLAAIGALCFLGALLVKTDPKQPYWLFVAFLTPAIVLLESAGHSVVATADARLGFTLLGTGVALGAELLLRPAYRRNAQRLGLDRY